MDAVQAKLLSKTAFVYTATSRNGLISIAVLCCGARTNSADLACGQMGCLDSLLLLLLLGCAAAVMEIDAVGTFTMSKAAYQALSQNAESVIINISATLHYGATWYQVHASAAKAAVDSITRSLALEWGEYGVRVNGVAPGPIRGTAGDLRAAARGTCPLGTPCKQQ